MSTKTCKGCGWVYPITQPGRKCRICGTPFEEVYKPPKPIVVKLQETYCEWCGEDFSEENKASPIPYVCMGCYRAYMNEATAESRGRLYDRLEARFNNWLDKVKRVPKNSPTLTEAQWLEACSFFNGCARCDSDEIDTRGFFISRRQGGRYCNWNVIPLCEHCAKIWQTDKSMFVYTMHMDYSKRHRKYKGTGPTEYRDNLKKIVEYLEVRLDAAINISRDTNSTSG